MADKPEIKGLINLLQGLYSRVAQTVVNLRQTAYRKGAVSGAEPDLSALLSERVERLAQASEGGGDVTPPKSASAMEEGEEAVPQHSHSGGDEERLGDRGEHPFQELGAHFHACQVDNLAHAGVGDKIKCRVLEHINNALRHARAGDRGAAKMSLEIARASLTEAAHYMGEEEYRSFTEQVTEQLRKVTE